MLPRYIVQRCKKDTIELYGPRHAADNSATLCGYHLSGLWFITHNDYEMHLVTCKRCLALLRQNEEKTEALWRTRS